MSETLSFDVGSPTWHEWRRKCLEPSPGRFSSLYFLNARVLNKQDVVPMRYRTHWALCLFAEAATGIPEIDQARVRLIQVFRGGGKSTLITTGRTIQQLLRTDGYAVGIANETNPNASAFLSDVRLEFETNDLLRALFPERIPADLSKVTWRQDRFVLNRTKLRRDPSGLAAGAPARRPSRPASTSAEERRGRRARTRGSRS